MWATSHTKLSAESRCKSSETPRNKAGAAVSSGLWTGPVHKVAGAAGKQAPSTQPGIQRSCDHSLVRTFLLAADGVSSHVLSHRERGCSGSLLGGAGLVAKSCLTLATPWTVARQAPLSKGFSRQEYWSGLPFPSPGESSQPRGGH